MNISTATKNFIPYTKKVLKTAKANGTEGVAIARRVSKMKQSGAVAQKILETKSFIKHAINPFLKWASDKSPTIGTILKTSNKVSRNINKCIGRAVEKNPNASKVIAGIKGVDASLPVLGTAALAVTGAKDINQARKEEGTAACIKEAGKSAVRLTTSAALAATGAFLVPVPGMATAGWLAGETLANLAVGKPYSVKHPKTAESKNQNDDIAIKDTAIDTTAENLDDNIPEYYLD